MESPLHEILQTLSLQLYIAKLVIIFQVFEHVPGAADKPAVLSGAMFFHLTADDYACTDKNRIVTSKEIRRRLRVLEQKESTTDDQARTRMSSREEECWEVLLLCYNTAQKIKST